MADGLLYEVYSPQWDSLVTNTIRSHDASEPHATFHGERKFHDFITHYNAAAKHFALPPPPIILNLLIYNIHLKTKN